LRASVALGLVTIPLAALGRVRLATLQGLKQASLGQLTQSVGRTIYFILFLGVATAVTRSTHMRPETAVGMHALAFGAALAAGTAAVRRVLPSSVMQSAPEYDGRRRRLPDRAVAVTFDDGYADNLEVAAPILLEHGIPATLFVTTDLIDSGALPWWDELASLLLEPAELPPKLTLSSGGDRWRIPPVPAGGRPAANASLPWEAEPGTRLRVFYEVWLALRALDAPTREAALEEIAEWTGTPRASGRVLLTWEQLGELAALPAFELGAHTLTHPALPSCSPEEARAEIAGGADRLRARAGVEVEQFAYPFGAWTPSVARLVAELGFRAAYTTDGNAISWSSSPHALPRVPAQSHSPRDFAGLLAVLSGR
jgi:peptidoglycan/xylan/chitin deacetylase (PgdA/CDA1 family)